MHESNAVKEQARRLVEGLPEDVSWDEFARRVWERRMIEASREDVAAGRTLTTEQMREKFGLKP